MNALASKVPPPPAVLFRLMIALTVLFFLLVGATAAFLHTARRDAVPLNPCRQCANSCPCPRMNGSVRCGCPN